jgi:hypothetical protein
VLAFQTFSCSADSFAWHNPVDVKASTSWEATKLKNL